MNTWYFGEIIDLIVPPIGECLFILKTHIGYTFSKHYNSYEVNSNDQILIYTQRELADYHTRSINKSFARGLSHKNFVCVKYHVFI